MMSSLPELGLCIISPFTTDTKEGIKKRRLKPKKKRCSMKPGGDHIGESPATPFIIVRHNRCKVGEEAGWGKPFNDLEQKNETNPTELALETGVGF